MTLPRRRPLAEIDPQWICTIVGTSLTLGELKALQARLKLRIQKADPSDYDIHSAMVHLAGHDAKAAKVIGKALDRKHAAFVSRFARATRPAEVASLWRAALARGEVGGACWAAMSHGATDDPLRKEIFGDIHMLSHQVGSATSVDLKRIHALETEKTALEAKVARQQERLRQEITARDREIAELRQRLEMETTEARRLAHAVAAASEMAGLRAVLSELRRDLEIERRARERAERASQETERQARHLAERTEALDRELAAIRADNEALEARLSLLLGGDQIGACDPACRKLDLCGRCILYVGGRNQQVRHLRRLVETSNGTFVHHDGGIEESLGRLPGLLARADAVLFPVDCVGHAAHDQVKRLCKRMDKAYLPVPRSGLGAFMRALEAIPEPPA